MTPTDRKALRRKALWRVSDLAAYMGASHKTAMGILQRYNAALGGKLLRPSRGSCRVYTFLWRPLAKHDPGLFLDDPLNELERLDAVEDQSTDVFERVRMLTFQTGQNSRDIAKLKSSRRSSA